MQLSDICNVGGQSKGDLADRALLVEGMKRKVAVTAPHYLVAPSILRGTNLLTILGDGIFLAFPDNSELLGVVTPFKHRPLNICLVFDPFIYRGESHRWIRDLIIEIWKSNSDLKKEKMGGVVMQH